MDLTPSVTVQAARPCCVWQNDVKGETLLYVEVSVQLGHTNGAHVLPYNRRVGAALFCGDKMSLLCQRCWQVLNKFSTALP